MSTLIGILSGVIFSGLFILLITWGVHISMVKGEFCPYGWATYSKFKREFDKYNWEWDKCFENSLFDYPSGGYIHASIFKFDYKGMIMRDPFSYFLSALYIRRYIRKNIKPYRKDKVKW
jgi:hypothetical protein